MHAAHVIPGNLSENLVPAPWSDHEITRSSIPLRLIGENLRI